MPNEFVAKNGLVAQNNSVVSGSLIVTNGITGSLFGTSSQAISASNAFSASFARTSSFANNFTVANTLTAQTLVVSTISSSVVYSSGSNIFGNSLSNTQVLTGSVGITGSLTVRGNQITSGSSTITGSLTVSSGITGSLFGTASWATNFVTGSVTSASFASTASFVNILNQNVIITGSLTVGQTTTGAGENTLTLGPAPAGGAGEGGQLLLMAKSDGFTSASMLDVWQNQFRILRGTNASSDGLVAQWNLHSKQVQFPAYTGSGAFTGTVTAFLAVDSGGNILTTTGSSGGGSAFPFTGSAQITGSLGVTGSISASGAIISTANGTMYFRGGDDAELWDINVANTVGVYGQQDQTVASIKLGSGGGTISGRSGNIGIGTITPNSASLHINGNVFATSFTGSLLGTAASASYAFTASSAVSSSYAYTASSATTASTVIATVTGTNSTELVRGNMADNDQFRILVGGTATNAGFAEIATADDGTEPIHVRQYSGVFASLVRTATLLDGSGNTSFPGTVSAAFSGNLTGTASFASNYIGSGSISTRLTNLETASGSLSTRVTNTETTASNLVAASASFSTRITNDSSSLSARETRTEITASNLVAASGSFSTRVTQIERTYATTGSNIFTGSQNILGAITASAALINGTLTAQTLVVTTISSSVVFSSGSNIFGNSTANTQTMTGSLNVSGSATIIGRVTATNITGSLFGTASQAITASYALGGDASAILYQTASAAFTWSFNHFLQTQYPVFTIYDNTNSVIVPQRIQAVSTSSALIYFSSPTTGIAVASKGGYSSSVVISAVTANTAISASFASSGTGTFSGSFSGSYQGNFSGSYFGTASQATSASYAYTASSAILASASLIATSASFASTASNVLGGITSYVPLWNSATTLGNSVIFQSSSNIGIGLSPQSGFKLDVGGQSVLRGDVYSSGTIIGFGSNTNYRIGETGNSYLAAATGNVGIGHRSPSALLHVSGSGNGSLMQISSTVSSSIFFVSGSGNVGIGTITPEFKLDVSGSGQARIGAAELGNWPSVTNYAFFGHERLDQTAAGNYALLQDSGGSTYVNASTGRFIALRINNITTATVESTRFTFTGSFGLSGSMLVTGSITGSLSGSVTGSLFGTASQAVSSSYALTASFALNGGGGASFPFTGSAQITGSLGVTGSFSLRANTGSIAFSSNADTLLITGSLIITGSGAITGSLSVSSGITGSLFGTASQAVTASYALTASYVASIAGLSTSQIATGSITASVSLGSGSFAVTSGSSTFFFISSSGESLVNTTIAQNVAANRGNLTINGTTSILNLATSNTNAGYIYHSGTDMLIVNSKNGALTFATNNTERVRIDSSGRMGIGTSTPSASLDVSGSVRYTNGLSGTGSVNISGSLTVTGSITTNGTITAQTLVVQTVTSSIVYSSGSNIFGNALTNTQTMTGSVNITGSLTLRGNQTVFGVVTVQSASFDYGQNTNVVTGSFQVIASEATSSFRCAFFDYVMFSGSVVRAGTVTSTWSGGAVEFNESYTNDLSGSTAGVILQTALSGGNIQLQATASSQAWTIRSLIRLL